MSVLPNSSFADNLAPFSLTQGNPVYKSEQQSKDLAGYTMIPDKFYLNKPTRNALGLVGGNDVSVTSAPMTDVESDLLGITRPNTKCNYKQYVPECALGGLNACPNWPSGIRYTNATTGEKRFLPTQPKHLPTSQMISYQGVNYPTGFVQETGTPWRF